VIHTFNRAGVARLLAHTRAAPEHDPLHDKPETAKPGLWLVGDEGVYLVSNGKPMLTRSPRSRARFVVYADEVNPKTLRFEVWWAAKQSGFGGDDGVEFLAAELLEAALLESAPEVPLQLDITERGISILMTRPRRPARRKTPKR
jgi:hypothetical protein